MSHINKEAMRKNPLAIDLFCGLGGWAEGLMAEGFDCIGFDIERHKYQGQTYPAQLVLQDVRTLDGRQFRNADLIVASPPCQEFSRHDQPWTRALNPPSPDLSLVKAVYRIASESGIPIIMENVRGAQRWIGTAKARYGSQYLWGDVPPLLPQPRKDARQKQSYASSARALRAKIPFELARHIGRVFA